MDPILIFSIPCSSVKSTPYVCEIQSKINKEKKKVKVRRSYNGVLLFAYVMQ